MNLRLTDILFVMVFSVLGLPVNSADWPTWKHDSSRSAVTEEKLEDKLTLLWKRELGQPVPAWPANQKKLLFDETYEPVLAGKLLLVPFMTEDKVVAFDTDTGKEIWRYYADGPVRFAPVIHRDKLFFVSDDGFFRILNLKDGSLVKKIRAAPDGRQVIGNNRMISMWPLRGAPVLFKDNIYFAAGIWPFMGIFIYSVKADATGEINWLNSGSGSMYILQQHYSPAFAGVAPQGYFAAAQGKLLVAGGRTVPAVFDIRTGKFLYYHLASRQFGKGAGGFRVSISGGRFFNGKAMYDLKTGKGLCRNPADLLFADNAVALINHYIEINSVTPVKRIKTIAGNRKKIIFRKKLVAKYKVPKNLDRLQLLAGNKLYCSGDNQIAAFSLDNKPDSGQLWRPVWSTEVPGNPLSMIAGDKKLFVVTSSGSLYCFGAENNVKPFIYPEKKTVIPGLAENPYSGLVRSLVEDCNGAHGYCVSLGIGTGKLISELLRQTKLHIIVLENKESKKYKFRKKMDDAGFYGRRVAVISARIENLPSYCANLLVAESFAPASRLTKNFLREIYRVIRPYGGTACFPRLCEHLSRESLKKKIQSLLLPKSKFKIIDRNGFTLTKVGALPETGTWTHQYADSANTVTSKDKLVKLPLGILWFGGPTNAPILPRHGHGPTPQVIGGRVIIEGMDILRAVDVYTGRLLWETGIKGIGKYYNVTRHFPGANEIGSNYVSLQDVIYAITPDICHVIDSATGKIRKKFVFPSSRGKRGKWGFICVSGEYLIAAADQFDIRTKNGDNAGQPEKPSLFLDYLKDKCRSDYAARSLTICVMNRRTGEALWSRKAENAFRHNAIVANKDTLFCIDAVSSVKTAYLKRKGVKLTAKPTLYALDLKTGAVKWKSDDDIFGTWLGYSKKNNVLLQAGSAGRDRAGDEAKGRMAVYDAVTGKLRWKRKMGYSGPCMLHKDLIITQGSAFDMLTGKKHTMRNPLSGEKISWSYSRNYGCNTAIACENLLTFRSAAAGFFDLQTGVGTGNWGGFKSGCTSNLIAADGVLNAPDYTRTCTCSYQNQSSLALIHMPDVELWYFSKMKTKKDICNVGINFGAPGIHVADTGIVWLNIPKRDVPAPELDIRIDPPPAPFLQHSSVIKGKKLNWVAASGIQGAESIRIRLRPDCKYRVKLYFCEPCEQKKNQRVFSVYIQDKKVISSLDIVNEAKGSNILLEKIFDNINISNILHIRLKPVKGKTLISGIELTLEK